jgi:hypothetical protein
MKKISNLKIAIIIAFLMITFNGGTLTLCVLFWLILGTFGSIIDLTCSECDHLETIKDLILIGLTLTSLYFIFYKKKYYVLLSIIIQYIYIMCIFENEFIKHWYFSLPLSIYLILSFILIYLVNIKKKLTK